MTRRVWAAALGGCLAGIPLSEERKLRRLPVPLRLSWKRWQQFPGKELETVSVGEVGQPLFWLLGVCQRSGGAGVDGMTLAWAPFHSLLLSTSSVSSAPGGG